MHTEDKPEVDMTYCLGFIDRMLVIENKDFEKLILVLLGCYRKYVKS